MWIARDESGELYAFLNKPIKGDHIWKLSSDGDGECSQLPEECFSEVKWSDNEPRELILK